MAVLKDAVILTEKGYATMAKSTVVPFDLPSEFSPDPLTEVIRKRCPNPTFLKSTENAVRWILGELDGASTRNPDVSAKWDAKSKKDAEG